MIAACSSLLKTAKLPAIVSGPAYLARGNAYATNAADFSKALDDFNSASDILAKDPAPLNAAGIVLLKQRKLMEAFGAFDAANEIDGRDPTALYGRAVAPGDGPGRPEGYRPGGGVRQEYRGLFQGE